MTVEVKEMPELHVAYCRHMGSYQGVGQAFEKLMRWAGPRGQVRRCSFRGHPRAVRRSLG
jgi:DNA gyrase inhibitor GyrI